jgi:GntR family transcriptional regulator, transcriptional repressor for pyruvate dehydrogenase complex
MSIMVKFPRINSGRRVDIVANILRRAVLKGTIAPSERLPSEREMAEQFGVGRLVVREALRSLESMGLIEVRRGVKGGCFVRDFNMRQISRSLRNVLSIGRVSLKDMLEARLAFESEILRLAIERATSEDLERIETNIRETKALAANGSEQLKERVHEFHLLLAQTSKNPLYLLMMHSILDVIDEYMTALEYDSVVSLKTVREHEEIARCLRPRNRAKALTALCGHIMKDNRRLARRATKLHLAGIEYLPSL